MWRTGDLARLRRSDPACLLSLVEAALWLAAARAATLTLPFRWTAWLFALRPQHEQRPGETTAAAPQASAATRHRIFRALGAASSRTPWKNTCLAQALAGSGMLRMRGIPATVALGAARGASHSFEAHAWLYCGEFILTGASGHERYRVVGKFSAGAAQQSAAACPPL